MTHISADQDWQTYEAAKHTAKIVTNMETLHRALLPRARQKCVPLVRAAYAEAKKRGQARLFARTYRMFRAAK